jgi:hypothetical protein
VKRENALDPCSTSSPKAQLMKRSNELMNRTAITKAVTAGFLLALVLNAAVEPKTAENTAQKLLLDTMSTLKVTR